MKYAIFEFPLMPKPRGKVSKHGNIFHNNKEYENYKKLIRSVWRKHNISHPTIDRCYVGLFSLYTLSVGGNPDLLDNQLGGILDSLTQIDVTKKVDTDVIKIPKQKILKDDNRKVCFGDKILSHQGDRDFNIFILGSDQEIYKIDSLINQFYVLAQHNGDISSIVSRLQ